jgi:uracil-DNA glycosylase family 4
MQASALSSTDDIAERYLKRAISEMNDLGSEIAKKAGPEVAHVLGSGHPLADIFMLKYTPQPAELQEGVAFFGRSGKAILKSLQRLRVDPTAIYGTNVTKLAEAELADAQAWIEREIHIVQPKVIVVMGDEARAFTNELEFPLASPIDADMGVLRQWTPTSQSLVSPDIDESLDEQETKRAFWEAFKALGPWWAEQPPY